MKLTTRLSIAIDFDGTIVDGSTPLPKAKEALWRLKEQGHYIIIHSCNRPDWIRTVLNNNDIPYDDVWEGKGKPVCDWYIDDRAIHFNNDWPRMLRLMGISSEEL